MNREKRFTEDWSNMAKAKYYLRTDYTRFRQPMFEIGKNFGSNLTKHDAEWEANAHLIASAPELLFALERLMDLCELDPLEDSAVEINDAKLAIAKAYGESHE